MPTRVSHPPTSSINTERKLCLPPLRHPMENGYTELTRIANLRSRLACLLRRGGRIALLIGTSFPTDCVVFQPCDVVVRDRKPHHYLAADFVLGPRQPQIA